MRTFACAILLCVLIYVGIRMAITTIASDKAMYKKMLVDWICSLALIFLLQYIIIFTLNVNSIFIEALEKIADQGADLGSAMKEIGMDSFGANVNAIASTVVYCMLVAQTFGLLISYINRMLKLAFLIIISPLITLTYSIDKMGDGKAQALGNWLREFVFTVLIQPFHCIIYMAFVSTAFNLLIEDNFSTANSLAGAIIAVLCLKFTKEAEKIVRKIFAFKDDNSSTSMAVGMAATAMALSKAKSVGKSTGKVINGAKNIKEKATERIGNAKVEALAVGAMIADRGENKKRGESRKSFTDYKESTKDAIETKKEAKLIEKSNKKYGVKKESKKTIEDAAKKIRESNPELTKSQAMARARKESANSEENKNAVIARKKENAAKKAKSAQNHPHIAGFKGMISDAKDIASNMDTFKDLGSLARVTASGGIGLMVGAQSYGATGNFGQALGIGIAAGKGTEELLKSSTNTLAKDASDRLKSVGSGNPADAETKAEEIIGKGNSGYYDDADAVNDMMKEIENALKELGVNGAAKNNIRKKIDKGLQEHPERGFASIAKEAISPYTKGKEGTDAAKNLQSAAGNYAQFGAEKEFYNDVNKAGELGLNPNNFVKNATSRVQTAESDVKMHTVDTSVEGAIKDKDVIENLIVDDDGVLTDESIRKAQFGRQSEIDGKINRDGFESLVVEYDEIYKASNETDIAAHKNSQKLVMPDVEERAAELQKELNKQFDDLQKRIDMETSLSKDEIEKLKNDFISEITKQQESLKTFYTPGISRAIDVSDAEGMKQIQSQFDQLKTNTGGITRTDTSSNT